jgi:hypothetical protein
MPGIMAFAAAKVPATGTSPVPIVCVLGSERSFHRSGVGLPVRGEMQFDGGTASVLPVTPSSPLVPKVRSLSDLRSVGLHRPHIRQNMRAWRRKFVGKTPSIRYVRQTLGEALWERRPAARNSVSLTAPQRNGTSVHGRLGKRSFKTARRSQSASQCNLGTRGQAISQGTPPPSFGWAGSTPLASTFRPLACPASMLSPACSALSLAKLKKLEFRPTTAQS